MFWRDGEVERERRADVGFSSIAGFGSVRKFDHEAGTNVSVEYSGSRCQGE